jgi:hypothetical protein
MRKQGIELSLFKREKKSEPAIKERILKHLLQKSGLEEFRQFIHDTDDLRNNLAHANSSDPLHEIKGGMTDLLERYKRLCIKENILA